MSGVGRARPESAMDCTGLVISVESWLQAGLGRVLKSWPMQASNPQSLMLAVDAQDKSVLNLIMTCAA